MLSKLKNRQQGFTLIEVLLVVAIIAILAGIVILAINPNKQLGDTRNSQRRADVNTIINAIYQYSIDNQGNLPTGIPVEPAAAQDICMVTGAPCSTPVPALVDLNVLTLNGKYLVAIPKDPKTGTATNSNYTVRQDVNGRVTVAAPDGEQGVTNISVTR